MIDKNTDINNIENVEEQKLDASAKNAEGDVVQAPAEEAPVKKTRARKPRAKKAPAEDIAEKAEEPVAAPTEEAAKEEAPAAEAAAEEAPAKKSLFKKKTRAKKAPAEDAAEKAEEPVAAPTEEAAAAEAVGENLENNPSVEEVVAEDSEDGKKKSKNAKKEKKPVNKKKLLIILLSSIGGALLAAAVAVFFIFFFKTDTDKLLDSVNEAFTSNAPTKIVVTTSEVFGDGVQELNGEAVLVKGKFEGKNATVYTYWQEKFADVEEDGAVDVITSHIKEEFHKKEYLEDKGVRVDGGKWDDEEYDFAPVAGDISLNLSTKNLVNIFYQDGILYATIPAGKAASVLGEAFDTEYEINIEIATYDGFVTYVLMGYEIPETKDYPEISVTIKSSYSYGIQSVNID